MKPGQIEVHFEIDQDLKKPRVWMQGKRFEVRAPKLLSQKQIIALLNDWALEGGLLRK